MPDTGTKRKSRAGSREGDGADDDDGTGDKNELAEMQAWLDTVPLISVAPPKQDLFQLEHAMTVGRCLEEFAKRKILSAPLVIEPALEDNALDEAGAGISLAEEGGAALPEPAPTLLGWLDTGDLLSAFLQHLEDHLASDEAPVPSPSSSAAAAAAAGGEGGGGAGGGTGENNNNKKKKKRELPTRMLELMTLLEKLGPSFAAKKLITVSGGQDRALVFSATAGSSLLEAMRDLFLPTSNGDDNEGGGGKPSSSSSASTPRVVHRVAVFDGHGAITHVISQLDVLRFLAKHKERWSGGALGGESIAELGLLAGKRPVLTVDPHTPSLLALREMKAAGVSGAAVVSPDGSGTAIANFSVSDLRAVDPKHLSVLALPVAELLALLHKTTYVGYSAGGSAAAAHPFFAGGRSGSGGRATPVPSSSSGGGGGALAASSPSRGGGRGGGGGGDTAATTKTATATKEETPGGGGESNNQGGKGKSGNGNDGGGEGNEGEDNNAADDDDDVRFIACTPSTTLLQLINIFLSNSVHRVYVVDDLSAPRPTSVVTPTDVFRVLAGVF